MRKFYPFAKLLQLTAKNMGCRLTLLFLVGLLSLSASAQTTRYVNGAAAAGGDGLSWATAYNNLQAALDVAVSSDEIWVAKGTYKPNKDASGSTTPTDARTKTFVLKSGVKLYGGFAGTESTLSARNVTSNKTILSGDLGTAGDNTDNAYHVLAVRNLVAATVLDGFTITGGNANSSSTFLVEGRNDMGAAIYMYGGETHLSVSNCVLEGNAATYGAFSINSSTSPTVTNCVFADNTAEAVYKQGNSSGTMNIVNCLFVRNTGGGFRSYGGGAVSILNSTFYGNTGFAVVSGTNGTALTMTNSIVWGNTFSGSAKGIEMSTCCGTSATVSYSNVEVGSGYTSSNNISADPAFDNVSDLDGADNIWMTADDGLHLRAASPAANSGNDGAVTTAIDITGAARKQGVVNMGAYESTKAAVTLYVNLSASGANNGTSWTNAYTSLQAALSAAVSGDEIRVAAGTYTPTVDPDGTGNTRKQSFVLKSGVKLLGGYNAATGTRDVKANKTILSGDLGTIGSNGDNAYHVVAAKNLSAATVLDGFTITGGNADNQSSTFLVDGDNGAGAAIYLYGIGTYLTINNCVIEKNYSATGALAALGSSSPKVTNCVFADNSGSFGAAVYNNSSSGSTSSYVNCLFVRNSSVAPIWAVDGNTSIFNCTFYGNTASASYSALYAEVGTVTITNSVVWGTTTSGGTAVAGIKISTCCGASATVSYSNIEVAGTGYTSSNNISADPAFVDAADPDGTDNIWGTADDGLHLSTSSPSANTGNNSSAPAGTDITGAARIQNATVNMGAYETLITKTAQTITFSATGTKTYGDAPFTVSATASSGLTTISYSIVSGPATISGNTVTITGAGSIVVKATQAGDATYDPAEETQTITVNKRAITITADAKSKVYGAVDPSLTYTITSGSLVSGDAVSGSLNRATGENAGTYAIAQNTLALSSNYILTYVGNDFTIDKKAISITAADKTKTYGDADPALTYTITTGTLVGSDAFTGSLTRAAGENVGTYAINQGSLTLNSNYTLTFVGANLTIDKKAVTVTAADKAKTYGDADPALTYSVPAGALVGSDAFTGSLERDAGETVGTYAIKQGTLALNGNYTLTYAGANLTIDKRAVTVTADALSKTYGDADPTLTYTITSGSLKSGDAFTGTLEREAGENAGSYLIKQGTLALNSNYDLSYVANDFSIAKRNITVTAAAQSKVYGDTDPTLSYALTSGTLVGSDALSGSLERAAGENVGSYAINIGTLGNTNYNISFVGDNLTINPRAISIKANDASKTQGETKTFAGTEYSLTAGTLAAGDAITSVTLSSTGAAAGAAAGTYDIVPSAVAGIATTNYTITYVNGTLTVNPCAAPTITTQPVTQVKCAGETVTFEVVASGSGLNYQWKKGTATVGTNANTLTLNNIGAADAGDYTVTITNDCGSAVTSAVATLTVNTVAVPTITQNGNILTSSAATGNQWYLEGAAISGATGQTHRVLARGNYTVKVTVGACTATSAVFNYTPTAIDNPATWNGEVQVYPVPATTNLYIKNTAGRKLHVQLFDTHGRKVRESLFATALGTIQVEGLASGTYQLRITDTQKQQTISQSIIKL